MSKPYTPPMPRDWWNQNPAYKWFMLRELSSVFVALFAIELLWFVSQADSLQNMEAFLDRLRHPLFMLFHTTALLFALLHSITWFNLTPRVMVIRLGEERVPDIFVAGSNYVACLVISLILWKVITG